MNILFFSSVHFYMLVLCGDEIHEEIDKVVNSHIQSMIFSKYYIFVSLYFGSQFCLIKTDF